MDLGWISANSAVILLALGVISLFLLVWLIAVQVRFNRLQSRYKQLMLGSEEVDLENLMLNYSSVARELSTRLGDLEKRHAELLATSELHIQRVALLRYNAFDQAGNDLSFSLALLNSHGDGVVVTSIFGRDETRMYAKPVVGRKSNYHLSDEENESIRRAMANR